jgi:hypothetical protein
MAIKRPDIYEHNNQVNAVVDSDFTRGGFRSPVANLTELYGLSVNFDQLKEKSTVVYVVDQDNYYELIDIINASNINGWDLFMGTGSPLTGATNGLSISVRKVVLGGNLINATSIATDDHDLSFTSDQTNDYSKMDINLTTTYSDASVSFCSRDALPTGSKWGFSADCVKIGACNVNNASNDSSLYVCGNEIVMSNKTSSVIKTVQLGSSGLTYGNKYHTSYSLRSLVDKEYVDFEISGASNVTNVTNTGDIYTTTIYDDFIGVSGSSCIYLYDTPVNGQTITITDICGNALFDPITVDGNGNNINDGLKSLINTGYGSIKYLYNGYFWSAIAFVN